MVYGGTHKCPTCHKAHDSLNFIVELDSSASARRIRRYCCSEMCRNSFFTEAQADKRNPQFVGIDDPMPQENKSDWERCKDYLNLIFGGQITSAQWSAIGQTRNTLKAKNPELTDKRIYGILKYAYYVQNWSRKTPSIAMVAYLYDEAKAYYEQKQKNIAEIKKSFEETKPEVKIAVKYSTKPRTSQGFDLMELFKDGSEEFGTTNGTKDL